MTEEIRLASVKSDISEDTQLEIVRTVEQVERVTIADLKRRKESILKSIESMNSEIEKIDSRISSASEALGIKNNI